LVRLETMMAQALKRVNNDRYKLSIAISQRANDLSNGAKPLIEANMKRSKFSDIAIEELAKGLLVIEDVVDK